MGEAFNVGDKGDTRTAAIWPDPNWRDTQDDPCTCRPRDGSDECPRYDECFAAFSAEQEAAR